MTHKKETNFYERVYALTRQIPYGRVTSYGAIARCLGAPQSARMVGWAMNNSHSLGDVPAHRVVNRNGLLTGKHHFPGTNTMQRMLESEGVKIMDDQVQNFSDCFWNPNDSLK